MDGSCHCRPGWTLPDCSKKIPPGAWRVRSDFSLGSEGWRSHNNSCAGVLETMVSNVPDVGHPDAVAKAIRGACANDGDGGDGGVEWDGAAGHLYLTDRLPSDGPGEIGYFRAPGKFLGDRLASAYDGTLSYELYLAGGGDASRGAGAPVGVPHAPDTDAERAPDVILVGGRPRYGLDLPPWDVWDKHSAYEWCRANFPELALNPRWSKRRLVDVVEAYLDTPQVVLGIRAPRGGKHHPPGACVAEHCSVNFNFDLREDAGWVNLATTPSGFGWFSDGDDDENARERGPGWIRAVEGTEYVGKAPGAPYDPFAGNRPRGYRDVPGRRPRPRSFRFRRESRRRRRPRVDLGTRRRREGPVSRRSLRPRRRRRRGCRRCAEGCLLRGCRRRVHIGVARGGVSERRAPRDAGRVPLGDVPGGWRVRGDVVGRGGGQR